MTVTKNLPYRQDDPTWGRQLMWDRAKVMEVHRRYNDASEQEASGLLRDFRGSGNTIANEGCLLTCLAMVLRLLAPRGKQWTPALSTSLHLSTSTTREQDWRRPRFMRTSYARQARVRCSFS